MDLKVTSLKEGGLSPDSVSDPEEKEISDDDDRNHKHRRRETSSQSTERDALEQVLVRPYRKRNKPFENGHLYRENNSQSSESWKSYNMAPMEKDQSGNFDKRRPGIATFMRASNRFNQSLSAELCPGRGRGKECASWSQRDNRFGSVDIASQMIPQGSVTTSLFPGRGVSNSQSASWSAFGLIPGLPNGGLDTLHPLGMQGTLRPSLSPPLNMGVARQRCRDFEERGFCLRGDMCPMEHGVNRIVVEDVQSLSQFNLPVSLPSAHLIGTPSALPSGSVPSSALINSKNVHIKTSKPGIADDELSMNGAFMGSACTDGADFYDPDQPLWTDDRPETSRSVLGINPSKLSETECLLDSYSADNERQVRSNATAVGSQGTSSSVWGRIGAKNKSEMKKKIDSTTIRSSNYIENEAKGDQESLAKLQVGTHQGRQISMEDNGLQAIDSSLKTQGDTGHNIRKPSQKALRTLFVNGIPQKDNRRESLLLHFRKFGEVIDIYIPLNSERAFVQFSKREEAEAALKAPDAVMGNRFIKLWWANRDNVPDSVISSGNRALVTPGGVAAVSGPSRPSIAQRVKDNFQSGTPKISVPNASAGLLAAFDHPKPVATNSPKALPPSQKKLDNLEVLKEELRKKQELLDQKRNDFRRQLDKLEKQATGIKTEVASEQAAKRQKAGTLDDVTKAAMPASNDSGTVIGSQQEEVAEKNIKTVGNVTQQSSKASTTTAQHESSSLKQSFRPLAPAGASIFMNRFKLDNRPTTFKINPPLPAGLANAAALEEHFSAYGELSAVELENVESNDAMISENCSARVSFTTRRAAEWAFGSGKCWQGQYLHFMWVVSNNPSNDNGMRENPPPPSKDTSDAKLEAVGQVAPVDSQKVAVARDGESENLERKDSSQGSIDQDEDLQPSSSAVPCEKVT